MSTKTRRYTVRVKRTLPDKTSRYLYVRETIGTRLGRMQHRLTLNPDEAQSMPHAFAMTVASDLAQGKTRENRAASVTGYPVIEDLADVIRNN